MYVKVYTTQHIPSFRVVDERISAVVYQDDLYRLDTPIDLLSLRQPDNRFAEVILVMGTIFSQAITTTYVLVSSELNYTITAYRFRDNLSSLELHFADQSWEGKLLK